jgi:cytochrome c-type biogenesis protein CcmH/NrfF
MNSSTPPPEGPDPGRAKRWADEFGVFASDATERLGALGRKLRIFNAGASQWVTTVSWRKLALLGFLIFVAASFVGDIMGWNRSQVRVDPKELQKPVDIVIHNDGKTIHVQPKVGGKLTRPIDIPVPEVPITPPVAPTEPKAPSSTTRPTATFDEHGIVFEKDGKRVVIDQNGVRVLEGEEARRDAEETAKAAAAKKAGRSPEDTDDAKVAADRAKQAADAQKEGYDAQKAGDDAARVAAASAKLSQAEAERIRQTVADDMSLQVRSAIEDAKDEVQGAITDQLREATRRAPPSAASVLWSFLNACVVMMFVYLIVLKATSNTKRRAAVAVASAEETAERESLKRQVSEARMQMMQAQVEPHFLFNTLASIDHLIETDPPRASVMQKNLIAYLRAALPQMRESATDLGRETELVRVYLEILKVRMEERLQVSFNVPNGLRSADFPPMMLQSVVENAIKHGLEPKAEGGLLDVSAQIEHGNLVVTVADTGLGFAPGGAPTSGTGLGLSNIRERLKLLYGDNAHLVIEANQVDGAPLGTRVSITVPYQTRRAGADKPA